MYTNFLSQTNISGAEVFSNSQYWNFVCSTLAHSVFIYRYLIWFIFRADLNYNKLFVIARCRPPNSIENWRIAHQIQFLVSEKLASQISSKYIFIFRGCEIALVSPIWRWKTFINPSCYHRTNTKRKSKRKRVPTRAKSGSYIQIFPFSQMGISMSETRVSRTLVVKTHNGACLTRVLKVACDRYHAQTHVNGEQSLQKFPRSWVSRVLLCKSRTFPVFFWNN